MTSWPSKTLLRGLSLRQGVGHPDVLKTQKLRISTSWHCCCQISQCLDTDDIPISRRRDIGTYFRSRNCLRYSQQEKCMKIQNLFSILTTSKTWGISKFSLHIPDKVCLHILDLFCAQKFRCFALSYSKFFSARMNDSLYDKSIYFGSQIDIGIIQFSRLRLKDVYCK